MSNDYIQPDAPDEFSPGPAPKKARTRGGGRGDTLAQGRRHRDRNRAKLREYARRYMAERRRLRKLEGGTST